MPRQAGARRSCRTLDIMKRVLFAGVVLYALSSLAFAGWDASKHSLEAEEMQAVTVKHGLATISLAVPAGWVAVGEPKAEKYPSTAFVRSGTDNFKDDMVLVQVFPLSALGENRTPMKFMLLLATLQKGCPRDSRIRKAISVPPSQNLDAFAALFGCPSVDLPVDTLVAPAGEVSFNLAIKWGDEMLLVRRTFRGPPYSGSTPPIWQEELSSFASKLATSIRICPSADPQAECTTWR